MTPASGTGAEAADPRRRYDRIAFAYDLLDAPFEYARYRPLRRAAFAGLDGRILDAGVGTGRNVPFYPPEARVTGIDVSEAMLARAKRRGKRHDANAGLGVMDVRRLAFPDARFEAVVATFLFCVLEPRDHPVALGEIARVCRPGGSVRLLDYVVPENRLRRAVMRAWAPLVRRLYGAAFDRDPEPLAAEAGLTVVDRRRFAGGAVRLLVLRPARR